MSDRVTSLDPGYQAGDLSVFPDAYDDATTLYTVNNLAQTKVAQAVAYNAKQIVVEDASAFPPQGLLCLSAMRGMEQEGQDIYSTQTPPGTKGIYYDAATPNDAEIVYYGSRTGTIFKNLDRGYCGSRRNTWPVGTFVANAVMAEPHNACKDATIQIERKVGTTLNTDPNSIYGRILTLEDSFLAPRAFYRAYPKMGPPPLKVRFQSVCNGQVVRYFWDFGDGTVSLEPNPTHVYRQEGNYTVKLTILTSTKGSGSLTKTDYISVSDEHVQPFFYVTPADPAATTWYSEKTATTLDVPPTVLWFIDQTPGDIKERYWVFGDKSQPVSVTDPHVHEVSHIYAEPGQYTPTLLVVYAKDSTTQQVYLPSPITIA